MKKRIKFNFLGIKFSFKLLSKKEKNIYANNTVNIDKNINYNMNIDGLDNTVDITCLDKPTGEPLNLKINIKGNNNKIIIKKLRTANLMIDIGNFTGVDNVVIEIDENFTCVDASILAYQSNVPVKIGKDCLFSKNIVIRTGELPHVVYDINTMEAFDKSDGIFIGNHVWLGEHVYIMKNAKLQENSIVGAMSVVTKRFNEPNVVIAGNPAQIKKNNANWADNHMSIKDLKSKIKQTH